MTGNYFPFVLKFWLW